MKRIYLTLLSIFFVCCQVQAKKLFVEMELHKNCIKLDDGTNKKHQSLKDENGKEIKFTSLIGALNYMSLQGWELVDTKSVTTGAGYMGTYGGQAQQAQRCIIFSAKKSRMKNCNQR